MVAVASYKVLINDRDGLQIITTCPMIYLCQLMQGNRNLRFNILYHSNHHNAIKCCHKVLINEKDSLEIVMIDNPQPTYYL